MNGVEGQGSRAIRSRFGGLPCTVRRTSSLVNRNDAMYLVSMARPKKDGRQVAVRLPEDLLARIDARVDALKAKGGLYAGITRSDVIREAVEAQVGGEAPQKGKAKR